VHRLQHGVRDIGRSGDAEELSTVADCHVGSLLAGMTRSVPLSS